MANADSIRTRKEAATDFLKLVVAGRIEEAYRKHVDMNGKHHNPFFPAGMPALRKAMEDNEVQSPNKRITVKHVLGDGDMVAVHSHLVVKPGETEMSVVHIFRFQGEKVVELWDCGQMLPVDSPNSDGAF